MIELSRDEAEIIHLFLCELRGEVDWKRNLSGRNGDAYNELSDCIGMLEARIEGGSEMEHTEACAFTVPGTVGASDPIFPAGTAPVFYSCL